ncbi:leucine-rich repeat protein [Aureivirga sp. CE67]|uniref:leucine-rich repeat protein n=1 Tax=Aureivirga sp. CE67 TaxID=1788983 RepID=UPI0018CA48B0|nr:leucine-rich repeat protein [Aureivirga sp. CE67]
MKTINDLLKENPIFGVSDSVLDLSNQGLTSLEGLENYEDVFDTLDLSGNEITKIENLDKFKKLKNLDLRNNKIQTIENLTENINLRILDFSKNQIEKIQNINHLSELGYLYLSENQIFKIENLSNLNLFTLDLYGNPIQNPKIIEDLNVRGIVILTGKIEIFNIDAEDQYARYIGIYE